jgi:polyhydroxybutyrate depolymerase
VIRLLAALLLLCASLPAAAAPCTTCTAAGGTYQAVSPPGWNGRTPLRLLVFLHGFMMEGADITEDATIRAAAARLNFLLIAPNGLMRSWSHAGSPSQARDDLAFLHAVLADAKSRWPIDPRAIVAAGFSQGASMVWDLACRAAPDYTAFLPFSGGFWEPMPQSCTSGPVDLRHVHGRDDPVVPLAGRALFGPYRQGDITRGFDVWRTENRCPAPPVALKDWAGLECESYACASNHRLQLCRRPGGHRMVQGDLLAGLHWAIARR